MPGDTKKSGLERCAEPFPGPALPACQTRRDFWNMNDLATQATRGPGSQNRCPWALSLIFCCHICIFATVVGGVILQKREVQVTFLAEGLPSEFHLGFGAGSVETGNRWKVDIYCTMQDGSTFAIEAVMAARGPAVIEEHRNRFEQVPNYKDAKHKEGRTTN